MAAHAGNSVSHRAAVLRKPIPVGGFGRTLTSTECRDLRTLGWSCSTSWIVVRQVSNMPHLGIVYQPGHERGYSHAGIYVETMD